MKLRITNIVFLEFQNDVATGQVMLSDERRSRVGDRLSSLWRSGLSRVHQRIRPTSHPSHQTGKIYELYRPIQLIY